MGQRVNTAPVVGQRIDQVLFAEPAEDLHLQRTIAPMHRFPRRERTLGMMKAPRIGIEPELEPSLVQAPAKLYVLTAKERGIEATRCQQMCARERGITGPKLPKRRLPIAAQHRYVLRFEFGLLPCYPRLRVVWQRSERANHDDVRFGLERA